MEYEPIQLSCRNCKKQFLLKSIVLHAKYNSECKHTYSPLQIDSLKTHSKQVSAAKKRKKDAERHLRTYDPVQRAKKHQEKYDPVQRAKKHQVEYDPLQRAKKYREIRVTMALK